MDNKNEKRETCVVCLELTNAEIDLLREFFGRKMVKAERALAREQVNFDRANEMLHGINIAALRS